MAKGLSLLDVHDLLNQEAGITLRIPGYWAEVKLGFVNEPFHREWYYSEHRSNRLCVVAPREYAKSEVFSVNGTAHKAIYDLGSWGWVFSDTLDQAKLLLERIVATVAQAEPWMIERMPKDENTDVIFANHSRVTVAGRGRAIRGPHPERIVGDDVLDEASTQTHYQREKTKRWWSGTVANMAHTGIYRKLGWGRIRSGNVMILPYKPSSLILVGTPFHRADLLMSMDENPIYHFRRYEAEFDPVDRVVDPFTGELSWAIRIAA